MAYVATPFLALSFFTTAESYPSAAPTQTTSDLELGIVYNIDTNDRTKYDLHFKIAEGWADTARVNIGMDMEGWHADPAREQFKRLKKVVSDVRARGMKLDLLVGGLPPVGSESWQKLGGDHRQFKGNRYSELPRAWWPEWVRWQKHAIGIAINAYGADRKSRIRIQLPNEVWDRGEDTAVDEFFAYALPKLYDKDGMIMGCPADAPSLWGPWPQLSKQIVGLGKRMRQYPEVYKSVQMVPVNLYIPANDAAYHNPKQMIDLYAKTAADTIALVKRETGRDAYFSEFGVSRVYDVWPKIWKDKTNEISEQILIGSILAFKHIGVKKITVYQSIDGNANDERTQGYGFADSRGKLRVDLDRFRRAIGRD